MAGHSKWKNIKHKKAAADKKKAKNFSKLLKDITVSARSGGGDVNDNPHLRTLIEKAHHINMPKENYLRAIKRGTGEIEGAHYEPHVYEGYGPGNIAIVVDVLSDNKNRAASEIRAAFNHNGGHIAEPGAVTWMFEKKGLIHAHTPYKTEEQLMNMLETYSVDDISVMEDTVSVVCDPKDLHNITSSLKAHDCVVDEAEIGYHPKNTIDLDSEIEEKAISLLEKIEDLEDVQNTYTNLG